VVESPIEQSAMDLASKAGLSTFLSQSLNKYQSVGRYAFKFRVVVYGSKSLRTRNSREDAMSLQSKMLTYLYIRCRYEPASTALLVASSARWAGWHPTVYMVLTPRRTQTPQSGPRQLNLDVKSLSGNRCVYGAILAIPASEAWDRGSSSYMVRLGVPSSPTC
jgi:hypothetical protein